MIETMEETRKECYILTNIKRRKNTNTNTNMNIDLHNIESIVNKSSKIGFSNMGSTYLKEALIFLLYNPSGDYSKEKFKKLDEQLSLLIIIKKNECSYKGDHYTKVQKLVRLLFGEKGIPNFKTFMGCSDVRETHSEGEMERQVIRCTQNKKKLNYTYIRQCSIFRFGGIGSSTILSIGYFLLKGVLSDIKHLQNNPIERVDYTALLNSLQESIQKLTFENRKIESSMEQEDICCICLSGEDLIPNEKCGHKFHTECLVKWLQDNNSCPVCRTRLVV